MHINVLHEFTLTALTVLYFIAILFNNWSKGWAGLDLSSLSESERERESCGGNEILITLRLPAPWLIIL